jgi:predicted hotdog family 3-hydroxylacyl-ACP dehydratase
MRLTRDEIAARIPHAGAMVLLDEVVACDDAHIVCRTNAHRDPANPLAVAGRLSAVCGIEFAAQAMAVHGVVLGGSAPDASKPSAGFLASVRQVEMHVDRLDDAGDTLTIEAVREAGDAANVLYRFAVKSEDRLLVTGRAAVVLQIAATP